MGTATFLDVPQPANHMCRMLDCLMKRIVGAFACFKVAQVRAGIPKRAIRLKVREQIVTESVCFRRQRRPNPEVFADRDKKHSLSVLWNTVVLGVDFEEIYDISVPVKFLTNVFFHESAKRTFHRGKKSHILDHSYLWFEDINKAQIVAEQSITGVVYPSLAG